MQFSIEHIEREMAEATLSPGQLADFRVYLAALFSMKTDELQRILSRRPQWWNAMREHKKSDKATDREWEATEDGRTWTFHLRHGVQFHGGFG